MNAIRAIHPYRHQGLWVFGDETVGLRQEPFVSGADRILVWMGDPAVSGLLRAGAVSAHPSTRAPGEKGTGHLLARKRWILREAEFTFGPLHKRGGYAPGHPECEPHGRPRRRRRLQVSPT